MKMTNEMKSHIDGLSYESLLYKWRFATIGDPMMQDETGAYWGERMKYLRSLPGGDEENARASQSIGWER